MKKHRIYFVVLAVISGMVLQSGCQKADQPAVSANNTPTPSPIHAISGTLFFLDGPLPDAEASLSQFRDEQCVKLNYKGNLSPDEKNQLKDCIKREVVKVKLDEKGNYKLTPPNPGLWQIRLRWWTNKTLGGTNGYREVGDFQVLYAEKKDEPGKVLFIATTKPIYLTGQEDVIKNLDIKK